MDDGHDVRIRKFTLGDASPDPGAGLLYCMRYSEDRILEHRERVVGALEGLEAKAVALSSAATRIEFPETVDTDVVSALVEELSCLNEALAFCESGFNRMDLQSIRDVYVSAFYESIRAGQLANAYLLVAVEAPRMVRDLSIAHTQNGVLSRRERYVIEDLAGFAKRQADSLDHPRRNIIFYN